MDPSMAKSGVKIIKISCRRCTSVNPYNPIIRRGYKIRSWGNNPDFKESNFANAICVEKIKDFL